MENLEIFLNRPDPPVTSVIEFEGVTSDRNTSNRKSLQSHIIMTQIRNGSTRRHDLGVNEALVSVCLADVLDRLFNLHPVGVDLVPLVGENCAIILGLEFLCPGDEPEDVVLGRDLPGAGFVDPDLTGRGAGFVAGTQSGYDQRRAGYRIEVERHSVVVRNVGVVGVGVVSRIGILGDFATHQPRAQSEGQEGEQNVRDGGTHDAPRVAPAVCTAGMACHPVAPKERRVVVVCQDQRIPIKTELMERAMILIGDQVSVGFCKPHQHPALKKIALRGAYLIPPYTSIGTQESLVVNHDLSTWSSQSLHFLANVRGERPFTPTFIETFIPKSQSFLLANLYFLNNSQTIKFY